MPIIKPMHFMNELTISMITHYQSSGSLYLHSLLDGHPQIMTIPGVPELSPIINGSFDTAQQALNIFNNANIKFYDTSKMTLADLNTSGLHTLGKNADEGIITDRTLFKQYFFECIHNEEFTPRNIIFSLYYAYAKSHEMDLNKKKVVLFHPHSVGRTLAINNLFPDAKYLVTIRESVRGYHSRLQRMIEKAKVRNIAHSHLGLLADDANNVYEFLQNNMTMRIIKVEDLAHHSKYIMIKLCEYLDIDYNITLEISSFGSKLYWGANPNYKSNKFMKKRHINPSSLKRKELLLFSIMNKELNQITHYDSVQLSYFEKKLIFLWLFLPLSEDYKWLNRAFYYNRYKGLLDYSGNHPSRILTILRLIKERLILLKIYIRNSHSKENYNKIKKYLINSNE